MAWEMVEVEAVLERIWDLHDKISDAIHAVSRAHFLHSSSAIGPKPARNRDDDGGDGGRRNGFVVVKDFRAEEVATAVAEARSLKAIRTALEDLEDQLQFFQESLPIINTSQRITTVQSQQQAERDVAIARLEQSRIALAARLAEHQGEKFKVVKEALAFVGDVRKPGSFASPEDVYRTTQSQSREHVEEHKGHHSSALIRMFSYSVSIAKNSFRLDRIGGIFGNAAVFAVSMLALLQLHQVAFRSTRATLQAQSYCRRRDENNKTFPRESSPKNRKIKHLDVLLARG